LLLVLLQGSDIFSGNAYGLDIGLSIISPLLISSLSFTLLLTIFIFKVTVSSLFAYCGCHQYLSTHLRAVIYDRIQIIPGYEYRYCRVSSWLLYKHRYETMKKSFSKLWKQSLNAEFSGCHKNFIPTKQLTEITLGNMLYRKCTHNPD
jgi:hypothetical protein